MTREKESSPIISRRLLLAKEFYSHALDRSLNAGALGKMIAVHNFHVAIEITLKSILLHYEIRTEKTLNIDFDSMLSEIDNHFKTAKKKLPYRQEIRNLNQLRNLVQHHAMEPEASTMEDWKIFTKRFLQKTYEDYFGASFDKISRIYFIQDSLIQQLLNRADTEVQNYDFEKAVFYITGAFEYASSSISAFLPHEGLNSSFFVTSHLDIREIREAFNKTFSRIRESEHLTAILGSGVSLADLKRFETVTPNVTLAMSGHPWFYARPDFEFTETEAKWALDFVVNSIISWQHQGLEPKVPDFYSSGATEFANGEWPRNQQ
jgi:hypothetical protein